MFPIISRFVFDLTLTRCYPGGAIFPRLAVRAPAVAADAAWGASQARPLEDTSSGTAKLF